MSESNRVESNLSRFETNRTFFGPIRFDRIEQPLGSTRFDSIGALLTWSARKCILSSCHSHYIQPIPDHYLNYEPFTAYSMHWLLLFPSAFTSLQYISCTHAPYSLHRPATLKMTQSSHALRPYQPIRRHTHRRGITHTCYTGPHPPGLTPLSDYA